MNRMGFLAVLLSLAACGGGSGDDGAAAQADAAALLFSESELHDVHLTMVPEDWESILQDSRGEEWRETAFQWKEHALQRVAVRPTGEFSRFAGNPKMSLQLRFGEFIDGQRFLGLKTLRLDGMYADPSFVRDRLSYGTFREVLAAPRVAHARLFVNGEYRGLYLLEERVDSVFVQRHFGGETGQLYRLMSSAEDPYRFEPLLGEFIPFPWEPKTLETTGDHSVVLRFVDVLNNRTEELSTVADVDRLLTYLALEAAVAQVDGASSIYGSSNHFQYYQLETGKFHIIPWDLDSTWWTSTSRSIFENFGASSITRIVSDRPELRAEFVNRVEAVADSVAHPDRVQARLDAIYAQIREAVLADPYKAHSDDDFEDSYEFIRAYAADRHASLKAQVAAERGTAP